MATVSFLYRSTRDEAFLKVRFFYVKEGKNAFLEASTKSKVTKVYWDKYHTAKRIADLSIKNFQTELLRELNAIENHILNTSENNPVENFDKPWLEELVSLYYNPVVDGTSDLLVDWLERYTADKKKSIAHATVKKANVVKSSVLLFEKKFKRVLKIKDVDIRFKKEYEDFNFSKGYAANTIGRNLSFIKTVCRYALVHNVEVSNSLSLVSGKKERVESIYLTEEDIKKIAACEGLVDHLDNARDWLLISCYTGQRVSDFMRFDKSMIREQKNKRGKDVVFIEFEQVKTQKLMSIPLYSKVLAILAKRSGDFPRANSDQKYNKYIKDVCEAAKINEVVFGNGMKEGDDGVWRSDRGNFKKHELVTSHIGRRSFATNNYGKIPTVLLMSMTGHSSEKMFLTYIGKGSNDLTMELSEYFD